MKPKTRKTQSGNIDIREKRTFLPPSKKWEIPNGAKKKIVRSVTFKTKRCHKTTCRSCFERSWKDIFNESVLLSKLLRIDFLEIVDVNKISLDNFLKSRYPEIDDPFFFQTVDDRPFGKCWCRKKCYRTTFGKLGIGIFGSWFCWSDFFWDWRL